MNLKALVTTLLAALLLASCADPITELKSGLTDDALSQLGSTVGTVWKNRAQTNISISTNGNSDSKDISNPIVIKQGNTYKMWYSGMGSDDKWRVIYATSKDGIDWSISRVNNPVIFPSTSKESEDFFGVQAVTVVYDNLEDRYKMWYIGHKTLDGDKKVFYAASYYENRGWIKYPNDERSQNAPPRAVIEMTTTQKNATTGKDETVNVPIDSASVLREVFFDGHNYHPSYNIWLSYQATGGNQLINANSFNGTTWKLQDFNAMDLATGSFFVNGIKDPVVIRDHINSVNAYKLWFVGELKGEAKFGYAISEADGLSFNYYDASLPPLFGKGEPGETVAVSHPWVIRDGNKYKMWYIGQDENTKKIFYRESLDY